MNNEDWYFLTFRGSNHTDLHQGNDQLWASEA